MFLSCSHAEDVDLDEMNIWLTNEKGKSLPSLNLRRKVEAKLFHERSIPTKKLKEKVLAPEWKKLANTNELTLDLKDIEKRVSQFQRKGETANVLCCLGHFQKRHKTHRSNS